MDKPTNITNPERMIIDAVAMREGIKVEFADGCKGIIPYLEIPEVGNKSNLVSIELPNPYLMNLRDLEGKLIEVPWDFARHYCDNTYRIKVEKIASEGMKTLGKRIRNIREEAGLTQSNLAQAAGIGRVTEVRIENGDQSPRYETLKMIAQALKCPIEEIFSARTSLIKDHLFTETEIIKTENQAAQTTTLKSKEIIKRALSRALENDWETSLRLLKEAESIVPNEFHNDIKVDVNMVWLCIQKTCIGPLLDRAENSFSMWDYARASEVLELIASILKNANYPLEYADYSLRIVKMASEACNAADRWENNFSGKLDRTLIGVSYMKSNFEAIIEKQTESREFISNKRWDENTKVNIN